MTRIRIGFYLGNDDEDGEGHKLGPGKVALLEAIRDHGSISAAARSMGMAYRHAWELVNDLNACFREPVVTTATGGREGGGAQLTRFGAELIRQFHAMEVAARRAVRRELAALEAKLVRRRS